LVKYKKCSVHTGHFIFLTPYSLFTNNSLYDIIKLINKLELAEVVILDVKWIFFDIGSTLVDETEAYDHRVREMIAGTDITFSVFDSKRIELAKQGVDGNSEAMKFFGLNKTPWHSEDEKPFADAVETLEALKGRGYRLGIIANQVAGTAQRLDAWGMLKYFDVVAASAELGVAKPDKLIFEKALELAGCQPHDSVMVGDRLDNDIRPAKELGMRTVWIRKGLSQYQHIGLGKNVADWAIDNLSDLKEIFR
jgi:putative hydrolase of the HAD superfamily